MSAKPDHRPGSLAMRTDQQFFQCLEKAQRLSRAAIAKMTGISKPTVSESAQRLTEKGIIKTASEMDNVSSKRPSVIYEINPDFGALLSLALEENATWIRITDFTGDTLSEEYVTYPKGRLQADFLQDMFTLTDKTLAATNAPLLATGVSVADPVSPVTGNVLALPHSPFPLAHGLQFAQRLGDRYQCPVTVDNDVNWATLIEYVNSGCENFAYIHLGRGIGCGLTLNGNIVRGADGMAGEIGYVRLGSAPPLLESLYTEHFYEMALTPGKALPADVLNATGKVVAATCVLTNPEKVVLGGQLCHHQALQACIEDALASNIAGTAISVTAEPEKAPLYGASAGARELALEKLTLRDLTAPALRGYSRNV